MSQDGDDIRQKLDHLERVLLDLQGRHEEAVSKGRALAQAVADHKACLTHPGHDHGLKDAYIAYVSAEAGNFLPPSEQS